MDNSGLVLTRWERDGVDMTFTLLTPPLGCVAMGKSSKKSKKGKNKKAKESASLPKTLRKGTLPSAVSDVMEAGLGALREAQSSGSKQFDELVKRGRAVQQSGSDAARDAVREVESAVDRVLGSVRSTGDAVVEGVQGRVESVVEGALVRLGVPTRDEVQALQSTVDALTARVTSASVANSMPSDERTTYEVRRHENGWAVQRVGTERASVILGTKKEALHEARALARSHTPSRLTVYKLDGTVSDTTEYDDA